MWTSTRPDYNRQDRERTSLRDGKLVTERIPQTGSQGEYDNRTAITSLRRWLPLVNHGGFCVPVVFTNAAADLNNAGPFAQYQWAMARALGWFWAGACPVALVATGELAPAHVAARAILTEQPCARDSYDENHPCSHAKLEQGARAQRQAEIEAARSAAYQSDTDRQIAVQRALNEDLITAQGAQQRALIEALLTRPTAPAIEDPRVAELIEDNRRLAAALAVRTEP